ncbi:uncharacterized protein LOC127877099 isoform X3 [Dreissena polymorpha]|uniref:Beta-lactamase-related domain-containing protein n=1 Tax=Dreissena polymorpha TaxID=45954 RepID=A0A9D4KQV8_DREPO|nr:uncharacterized protein LOC127877099 isoform X3 [Dreissena polymorpha]KAH3843702.1 hypothetical protein DPMN_117231 [Dreissena polymorpha]
MAAYKQCTFILILSLSVAVSGSVFDVITITEIEQLVRKSLECRHVPGMTLSVVKGDDVWARGFGSADISAGVPVDNSTLFAIGSVTKSFTMVLLGILLTEKKLDWTAKVMDILGPEYGFVDEYRARESTLKDLLSHRTGLDSLNLGILAGFSNVTREQLCKNMKLVPERMPFRDTFIYNNFMYMLLGHVAEKLGGDTWENLVTSRVLQPIGMTSSKLMLKPADAYQMKTARPYIYKDGMFQNGTKEIYDLHPLEPAGAILSNGVDMAKYIRFIINMGKTDKGEQLLDPELLKRSLFAVIPVDGGTYLKRPEFPVSDVDLGYGQGWFESVYRGYHLIRHSGGVFSYITDLWIFPEHNFGLFASMNGPAGNSEIMALSSTVYHVTDRLLGLEPWINTTTACTFPKPWRTANDSDIPPVENAVLTNAKKYEGFYSSPILSGFRIELDGTSNTSLRFKMGRLGGILYSTVDKDRFLMEIRSPWEFYIALMDKNNVTAKTNVTFMWDGDHVNTLHTHFPGPLNFTRRTQAGGEAANACDPRSHPGCIPIVG